MPLTISTSIFAAFVSDKKGNSEVTRRSGIVGDSRCISKLRQAVIGKSLN